jgi:hypothetical protein
VMGVTLCLDNEAQLGAGLGSRGGSFCLACRDQAAVPSGRGRAREKNAARRENRAASRCSGVQLKAERSWARIWSARGEASAPRNEPKMLVGVATVRMMYPKLGSARIPTG